MPVGPYETFDACVLDQQSKGHSEESARKICGYLEQQTNEAALAPRAEWNEDDHPRDDNGKFSEGGGGSEHGEDGPVRPTAHERLAVAKERLSAARSDREHAESAHQSALHAEQVEHESVRAAVDAHMTMLRSAAVEANAAKDGLKADAAGFNAKARDARKGGDEDKADAYASLAEEAKDRAKESSRAAKQLERSAKSSQAAGDKAVDRLREGKPERALDALENLSTGGLEEAATAVSLHQLYQDERHVAAWIELAGSGLRGDAYAQEYSKLAKVEQDKAAETESRLRGNEPEFSRIIDVDRVPASKTAKKLERAKRAERLHEREVTRLTKAIDRDGDGKTNEVDNGTTEADLNQKASISMPSTDRQIWKVEARSSGKALELDIYDDIGGVSLFGGGITAASVRAALKGQSPKETVVRIHSAGGVVVEGLAIYNLLKQMAGNVVCRVDSLAGSIASIIAMGGDELEMAEHSYLMIHNPFGMVEGDANELRSKAALLESMREQMIDIYAAKSGRSRDEIGRLMDEETWMTASEALAFGFANRIIPDSQNKLVAHVNLTGFRRAPAAQAAITPAVETATDTQELTMAMTAEESQKLADLEAAVATLTASLETEKTARATAEEALAKAKPKAEGDDDDDDDDDDEEAKAAKAAVVSEAMALTGCKDVKKLRGALVGYADSLKSKQSSQTVAQRVSALIKDGKLRPDMKAKALKMTHAEIDGYLEMTGGAKLAPVGEEHEPDEKHETVVKAKASASKPAFDPESVQLTADEKKVCRLMGGDETKALADKRERARAEHALKFGSAA